MLVRVVADAVVTVEAIVLAAAVDVTVVVDVDVTVEVIVLDVAVDVTVVVEVTVELTGAGVVTTG